MFSSKQDLVDLIFIVPLTIVIGGAIYIFNIKTDILFKNKLFFGGLLGFANKTNLYLLISLLINLGLITILRGTRLILKR
jgi:ABC-type cobalamin transport system permease subunit